MSVDGNKDGIERQVADENSRGGNGRAAADVEMSGTIIGCMFGNRSGETGFGERCDILMSGCNAARNVTDAAKDQPHQSRTTDVYLP